MYRMAEFLIKQDAIFVRKGDDNNE